MRIKSKSTNAAHEAFFKEMYEVVDKHGAHLPSEEILALAANFVGRLVAMQDQRKYTADQVMDLVIRNIQLGNEQMVMQLNTHLVNVEPAGHA